jgi:hypothetical protein
LGESEKTKKGKERADVGQDVHYVKNGDIVMCVDANNIKRTAILTFG